MTSEFIIFVIDGASASANEAEMLSIDVFNDRLRAEGHWLFAGGLATPKQSKLFDHRDGMGLVSHESLFSMSEHYSGFWLIRASNREQAEQLALEGSKACNRQVALRPLLA